MMGAAEQTLIAAHARAVQRRRTVLGLSVVITGTVFGLLLWARLLLVTGYPRTAIANPDEQAHPPHQVAERAAAHSAASPTTPPTFATSSTPSGTAPTASSPASGDHPAVQAAPHSGPR